MKNSQIYFLSAIYCITSYEMILGTVCIILWILDSIYEFEEKGKNDKIEKEV